MLYEVITGLLEVAEEKYGFKFERTDEALADMCSTAYTSDKALDAAEMDSIGVNSGTFVEALYCQDVLHFFNDKHGIKSEFIVLVNADTYVSTDIKKALLTDVYNTRCLVVSSGDEGQSATLVTETGYVLVCDKSRAEDWDIIGIRQCDASDLVHRDVKFETALASYNFV